MSIIVIRDGVMASDSMMLVNDHWDIGTLNKQKIFRLRDGSLFGGVGSTGAITAFLKATDREPSRADQHAEHFFTESRRTSGLRLMPNGRIIAYDSSGETHYPPMNFTADGAGQGIAIGAMEMGASARQACAIAIRRNMGARGKVQWLKLKGWR